MSNISLQIGLSVVAQSVRQALAGGAPSVTEVFIADSGDGSEDNILLEGGDLLLLE